MDARCVSVIVIVSLGGGSNIVLLYRVTLGGFKFVYARRIKKYRDFGFYSFYFILFYSHLLLGGDLANHLLRSDGRLLGSWDGLVVLGTIINRRRQDRGNG